MPNGNVLAELASDVAAVVPAVDAETAGRYGDGLGSESEERQVTLLLDRLAERSERYRAVKREVPYPGREGRCDLLLPDGTPVEEKLLRYWRANGDPEPHMYAHVFSPFGDNTLPTDAKRLSASEFERSGGVVGLFYQRAAVDAARVRGSPERFTAEALARKVILDLDFRYGLDAGVDAIEEFEGLRHPVHRRGAVIVWSVE